MGKNNIYKLIGECATHNEIENYFQVWCKKWLSKFLEFLWKTNRYLVFLGLIVEISKKYHLLTTRFWWVFMESSKTFNSDNLCCDNLLIFHLYLIYLCKQVQWYIFYIMILHQDDWFQDPPSGIGTRLFNELRKINSFLVLRI